MKWYCTFGDGQPNEGKVLPIIANSEEQVREYMYAMYDGKWCGTYSEEAWQSWNFKAAVIGWPVEEKLPEVDLTKGDN